nr:CHAT domain-containing protein [Nitrospirales bacterium]
KNRAIGEVRIAAKELLAITQTYPESVEAHREYINTKVMLKEIPAVQAVYRKQVEANPEHAVYRYSLGLALSYSNPPDFFSVISLIEQAIGLDPGIPYFYQTLGWAYEQVEQIDGKYGYLEKAEQAYRIALDLNDEFQFPIVESNLLLNLGNTYMALANYPEAYRHYRQRDQSHSITRDPTTELLFRKNFGEACFKTGHSEESIGQYRLALKRVPDDQPILRAELLERLGLSQQDLGRYSEAVQSYSQAMEINLELGNRKNLALLQRNIGVNLYNLGSSGNQTEREALKNALKSYFASLDSIQQFGGKQKQKGSGFFNVEVPLGGGGSEAASGFDAIGEEKLMFSYIAGTYEKLKEPAPAREYYLKKLALIAASPDADTNVARLTEKAVVLNRIGLLSHQLELPVEAIDYMRQSLGYTQTLDLNFGTRINVYNLSRLFAEQFLTGEEIEWDIVAVLVEALDEQIAEEQKDPQTFYALTNVAFLLSALSDSFAHSSDNIEDAVEHLHMLYTLKTHAWSYYVKARAMLEDHTIFPDGPNASLLLMLDLNMRDIALAGNNQEASARLQKNLNGLAEMVGVWNSWLWSVLQAEHAEKPDERQVWLRQAFDELMRYPPQALPRQHISAVMPFLDRLSALYVDGLVEDGRYEQAFIIAEQLAMRKMSLMLYEVMGEEFFLTGVGEYAEDLGSLIKEIRHGLSQGQPEQLEALSAELEEVLFALYEEYPWAVSYFWQYPLTAETLSVAVNAEHRYMKVVPGIEQSHGFIHHGTHVQYFPIEGNVTQVQEILRQPGLGYLSTAESLLTQAQAFFPNTIPVTRVSNSYEIINGFHQRSLFYTNVTVASKRSALLMPTAGAVSFSLQTLNGDPVSDSKLIEMTDVFVTMNRQKDLAFTVNEQLRVREFIRVRNLAGSTHHTAIILNSTKEHEASTALLVNALIRSGFPHVIVGHGRYDKETAEQFVGQYLARLTDMPPHEAVAQASAKVQDVSAVASSFVLYGYAGMNEEEKMAFASAIYADQLNTAVSLYQEGQYPQALQHMIHALSVIHYADKMEDFRELTKLVVDAAYKIGEYQTAVFHQNQLLQALGETATSEERSEAFYQLGILYSRLEQFDVAIQHLESANVLWLQAEELDRLAEGIATLGVVRENMGAYSEALLDFGRSYALYEEIGEVGDVATQHRRIGRIYYLRLGRYEEARKNFSVALESYRELEDRRGEAETLYEIGLTYEKIGLFEQADQYYQQGRQIGKELDDPFLIASGYLYLANTSWFRGSYQEAFQFLSRADTLARDAGDTQLTIMVHNTRGLMYWTLNDSEKALLSLHEAVTMAQEADIKTELASSLNNVGLVYRQQGDYVTALEYFEQAKHIDEVLNSRWGLGYDYRNIGISQLKMGKVVEAEENFIQAEQTSAAIKNAINWVKALLELGNVNRTLKKSEKAIGYYTQAYERAKRYGIKEVEWRAAKGKGGILWEQGNHVDAFSWYANAVTVVEGMRASLKIDELRNSFQVNKQDLYRETVRLLIEMDRIDEAFNYLERSRSRSFIDLLGNQKLTLNNEADQQALDTISVMSRRVEALKTEVGSYEEPPADVVARYRDAKTRYDQMVLELKQQNPGLSSFVSVDPLTLQDVQQMIAPDVGLLSYMVSTQGSYVWLIQESGVTFYPIPANEEAIAKIIGRYRQAVQQVESVDDELQALYAYLIAPVRQDLEDIKYLGIIPDGPLHFLSFAALKHAEEYLVDRYPIFYTPAASVLKFTFAQRRTEKATKVLAVGNPDLGNYNYDLPLAELEAQSIKWNYPDMDILTGAKATKEWFVEHIKDYGVIHLAAHGEFDEFNPLFSSLWLASNAPTNRRLTVKEVFGLEINADLVTLSACQTGLGKLEAGELIGLNRAFIYAGTHALVSALWRVDDLSTSVLMKHFYRNYVTMDKAKSLRQAQLLVKRDFPHPSYWAGFSLVGDYQ